MEKQIDEIINPWKMFNGVFIPNWLLERTELTPTSKLVYGELSYISGRDGTCFPSQKYISIRLGISERSIKDCLKQLKNLHLIKSIQRGYNKTNRYYFLKHEWMNLDQKEDDTVEANSALPVNGSAEFALQGGRICPTGGQKSVPLRESLRESLREKNVETQATHNKYDKDSIEFQLTEFCIKQIKKTHPQIKFTSDVKKKSCEMMHRLIKGDGKDPKEIKKVLRWLPYSPIDGKFSWRNVVQSPLALRRKGKDGIMKYDKLVSAMRANGVDYDDLIKMAIDNEHESGTEEIVRKIFNYLKKKPKFNELSLRFIQNDLPKFAGYNQNIEILASRLRG